MICYIVFTWLRAHWWPGTHCTAPAGVTVAWPGHNGDCAQASHWFVALRSAGVVARGRLVVCEVRCWATMLVGLMAAHAHPAGTTTWTDGISSCGLWWLKKPRLTPRVMREITAVIQCRPRTPSLWLGVQKVVGLTRLRLKSISKK